MSLHVVPFVNEHVIPLLAPLIITVKVKMVLLPELAPRVAVKPLTPCVVDMVVSHVPGFVLVVRPQDAESEPYRVAPAGTRLPERLVETVVVHVPLPLPPLTIWTATLSPAANDSKWVVSEQVAPPAEIGHVIVVRPPFLTTVTVAVELLGSTVPKVMLKLLTVPLVVTVVSHPPGLVAVARAQGVESEAYFVVPDTPKLPDGAVPEYEGNAGALPGKPVLLSLML